MAKKRATKKVVSKSEAKRLKFMEEDRQKKEADAMVASLATRDVKNMLSLMGNVINRYLGEPTSLTPGQQLVCVNRALSHLLFENNARSAVYHTTKHLMQAAEGATRES